MIRIALLVLALAIAHVAGAQTGGNGTRVPESAGVEIERAATALGRALGLDEAERKAAQDALDQASADEREADRLLAEARAWREGRGALAAEIARLDRELAVDAAEAFRGWRADLPERASHDELARRLTELQNEAEQASLSLASHSAELVTASARPERIAEELAEQRRRFDASLTTPSPTTDESPLALAEALAARAARRLAAARIQHLEAEQVRLPDYRRVLELRHRVQQRTSSLIERQIDVLEAMLAERTDAELEGLSERLSSERETLGSEDPVLLAEAERNIELGNELREAAARVRAAAERARQAQRANAAVADSLRNTRVRLGLGAGDDAVGLILLSERRRLVEADALARELEAVRRQYARVQLRLIEIDEQRDRLDAPEQAIDAAMVDTDSEDGVEPQRLRAALGALFETRAGLLPRIETAQRDLADALAQLERALQDQLDATRELTGVLDRELLWIPSHEPIGIEWLQRQAAAWRDLFKPARYFTSAGLLLEAARERWPIAALTAVLFVTLLFLRRRIPAQLEALSQPLLRVRTDQYRFTVRALVLSLIAALPWPMLVAVLGWLLQRAGQAGKFSDSLGASLVSLAFGMMLWQALRWLGRERGLGHLHFRWTQSRRAALRQTLPWIALVLLPLSWLLSLAFVRGQEPAVDAAARLMLLAFCAVGGWLAWRLLAPGAVWTRRGVPNIEPVRVRQFLRLAIPALLATLAVLALNGYVLTAGVMLRSVWLSVGAVLLVAVLNAMIARWFLLGERRLALKRLEQKREAEAASSVANADRTAATGDAMPELEPEEVTLESVNAQTRRLLRALTIALLALAMLAVWSEILPALQRLDEIALWNYSTTDEAGKAITAAVTLKAVLFGAAVLLLTFIAARNLPGLVEIGLLSRINLDAPTRYAITSISRYVIVIGGIMVGLGLFGLRWGQLQWMAAALTVGLGFGLQEIFANFVSGLIVLFERPYRVGDIITIGEVEGTVTRIRTRATTVLDWDNKEVVVPNKTFITERFVNWTLSDSVTRVVLKVGVAYASDPEAVRRLMLEVAEAEPMVLKQPPPTCWFIELGDSTLNFELRVFVGEILDRNRVRNVLNQRIVSEFRARDIEIAFPQMDLWVRNAPTGAVAGAGPIEASTRPTPPKPEGA